MDTVDVLRHVDRSQQPLHLHQPRYTIRNTLKYTTVSTTTAVIINAPAMLAKLVLFSGECLFVYLCVCSRKNKDKSLM